MSIETDNTQKPIAVHSVTEWGKQHIASPAYRTMMVDVARVQREQHKTPPDEILEGLRIFTAAMLVSTKRGSPRIETDVNEIIAANREAIDAALAGVMEESEVRQ